MICFRRVETRMFQPCRIVRAMAATNPYQMGWPTIRFRHVSWNLFAQCRATALDTTRLQWPSFDLVHSIRPRPGVSRKPGRVGVIPTWRGEKVKFRYGRATEQSLALLSSVLIRAFAVVRLADCGIWICLWFGRVAMGICLGKLPPGHRGY